MNEDVKPLIIVGAGPSSLAAAVYTTREDIDTTVYERGVIGGLAAVTDIVDNYPGFAEGVNGIDLAEKLQKQAERFGTKLEFGEATALRKEGDVIITTIDGVDVKSHTVLVATGSDYNKLGIPGEADHYGRGVHYCATCDGAFYRDKRLVVVGGGNSAVQETIFLTRYASHIDLLVRSTIKASAILQDDLQKYIDSGKVTVHLGTTTDEILSHDPSSVYGVRATTGGQQRVIETDGVFVFIGLVPNSQFLAGSGVELDKVGMVVTDARMATNIPGVYASGDIRSGATMQIASAVGEGATAALSIREYIDELKRA